MLDGFRGAISDAEPCPYLPDREWRNLIVNPGQDLSPVNHEALLEMGFRRMGRYLFRPVCGTCQECRPLRVLVGEYRPSKSHRRVRNRNRDLEITIEEPRYSDEKRELLARYLVARHSGPMTADEGPMRDFMFATHGPTLEFGYRLDGRLVGVGLIDLTPSVVSSFYFFYDPEDARRGLGIYSMLVEIEYTRRLGRRYYHPGFYVAGCSAMEYKRRFQPCEVLDADGTWRPIGAR